MKHAHQILLIASFIPLCWLAFMAFHELGHVLMGFWTGGTITKVVVHPFTISRTDVSPNPWPQWVVWGGPIIGVVLPMLIWGIFRLLKLPGEYLAKFFAGFCLIANGAYISIGSVGRLGDPGDLLRHGAEKWMLWIFGIVTIPLGLFLWNGLGSRFGLGTAKGEVESKAAYVSLALFIILFATTFLLSPRF